MQEHYVVQAYFSSDKKYEEIVSKVSDRKIVRRRTSNKISFENNRVRVGVQTWNHLSRLLEKEDFQYTITQDAPLRYLPNEDYSSFKFVRRSQGDYKTKENIITFPFASITIFLLVGIPALFIRLKKLFKHIETSK
jgi:hypothetical protein